MQGKRQFFQVPTGRYRLGNLTGPRLSDGESGTPWRGWNPAGIGRHWSVPRTGDYAPWIEDNLIPGYRSEDSILASLHMLDRAGLTIFTARGAPDFKRYLMASRAQVPPDVRTDVPPVNSQAKAHLGYPTRKPLALLDRIIKAGSNPGDMVLDPFCGCTTALVAADRLQRQ